MPDLTIEILKSIQTRLDSLERKMDHGFARIDARFDLMEARFVSHENALVDVSARAHSATADVTRHETAIERHDRELGELRTRVAKLEETLITRP